jgi:hypothetical protein
MMDKGDWGEKWLRDNYKILKILFIANHNDLFQRWCYKQAEKAWEDKQDDG